MNHHNALRLATIFRNVLQQCYNCKNSRYPRWGGRGIVVCDAWLDAPGDFFSWALSHGYSPELSLVRMDNDGPYEPGNCRWVTVKDQNRNRRDNRIVEAFGESKSIAEWSDDPRCVVPYQTLYLRVTGSLKKHWPPEAAITTKSNPRKTANRRSYRRKKVNNV